MEKEYAEVVYVTATGEVEKQYLDITGPTVEAEKNLNWLFQVIQRDGGKVIRGAIGTKDPFGQFHVRVTRDTPITAFDGFRRMSAFLRA